MSSIARGSLVLVLTAMLLTALVAAALATAVVVILIWAIRSLRFRGQRDG